MIRLPFLRGIVFTFFLLALVWRSAFSEPISRTINEIVALALQNSSELAALKKEVVAKHALAVQAGTLNNPTLELEGATGTLTGTPGAGSALIAVSQELPFYGKLRLRRKAAESEAEVQQRKLDNAMRLLKDEVVALALDYSLSDKRYELAAEMVKLNRELVTIAGKRFTAGDIPELELNLTKVELARAESRLLEVERDRSPLRISLASLTGLNETAIMLSETQTTPIPSVNKQDLVSQALSARPDLQALALEQEKADTESRLAQVEAFPNPTVALFAQWQSSTVEAGGFSALNSDKLLGLRLSMPIPLSDRNTGGQTAALARQEASHLRYLALARTVTAEVEAALARLSSSERILLLFERGIIPQLQENLKLTQEAYQIGELGVLSVIDEQKKFFEVNDAYLSALYARRMALSKLETAAATTFSRGQQ